MDVSVTATGALPESIGYHKHFPQAPGKVSRITRNHFVRATARRQARGDEPSRRSTAGIPYSFIYGGGSVSADRVRPQLEQDLHREINDRQIHESLRRPLKYRRPHASATAASKWAGVSEGRDLASSGIPLPSDQTRIVRRRSLEREDAFCDADTYKGNVHIRRAVGSSDDAQVAELYDMGLLYDDSDAAREPFNLNSIRHEEPVYTVRPAKRARKLNKARECELEQPLDLDLSFADLGTDEAIAHYLMSPMSTEDNTSGDEAIQHPPRSQGQTFAPLRVIYELVSSRPSFDVDTSQPPDLVNDILSDYDCFSDSELDDDTPSQRELIDEESSSTNNTETDARADPWVMLG